MRSRRNVVGIGSCDTALQTEWRAEDEFRSQGRGHFTVRMASEGMWILRVHSASWKYSKQVM